MLFTACLVAVAVLGLYSRALWIHRGLSHDEWAARWPGDEFVPDAKPSGSRALTIHAHCADVWPWLTQLGQDRAGFYSYRLLENLVGARMPNIRRIVPEWSRRSAGEHLVMAPPERFGPIAEMELVEVIPNHRLTFRNPEGVWSFLLLPIGRDSCRLVCRGTWTPSKSLIARAAHYILFDPIHFVMEWKMMRTIRSLAERVNAKSGSYFGRHQVVH